MSDATELDELPLKATETGTILWISIGLGTVASLPMMSGIANGTVSVARGAMWFLVATLVAMIGVWTISWLMHVFTDPFPGDEAIDDDAAVADGLADGSADAPAMSSTPAPDADRSAETAGATEPVAVLTDAP